MIVRGLDAACAMVGYPSNHGQIFQLVADQLNTIILGRAVGSACTGLIQEGYALKGFRIDAKSCDWGPMRGFVCIDPRLNKEGRDKEDFNRQETGHARSGHVNPLHTGHEDMTPDELRRDWTAGHKPLIISARRVTDLTQGRHITPATSEEGHLFGRDKKGGVEFRWRLIPLQQVLQARNKTDGNREVEAVYNATPHKAGDYYLLCVNLFSGRLWQEHIGGIQPITVNVGPHQFEVVQGLTNPKTDGLGFKACVTGDYDLFGVWPRQAQLGALPKPSTHDLAQSPAARALSGFKGTFSAPRPADVRPLDFPRGREHFQVGNISNRVNLVKVLLNTHLQSGFGAGFLGGQCVHHSDEVGNPNPALQKTLDQSMPVIAFVPSSSSPALRMPWGISEAPDFYAFAVKCYIDRFFVQLRQNWKPAFFDECTKEGLPQPPSPPY